METLAKSDVFFFITSVAVILLTAMCLIILFYGIRLFRTAVLISRKIKEEGDAISNDIAAIRTKVSEQGFGIKTLFNLISGFFGNTLGKTAKRKKKTSRKEDGKGAGDARRESGEGGHVAK